MRLWVECTRDGRLPLLVVYGRGVGIWEGKRQFVVAPDAVRTLIEALRDGGFAELAPSYGGRPAPAGSPGPDSASAIQVTCRVRLELAGVTKQVVQLDEGEQSAELARLAAALYALASPATAVGIEAASLAEGLAKIARGELAPETLSAMLHRKPELAAGAGERPAFLLRLDGRVARTRRYAPGEGYGPTLELVLGRAELGELAAALAEHAPDRLPANVWAPDYNDLSLAVLDRRVTVQARRFSGMTPATHGEAQTGFDAVAELFARLHERVVRDGVAVDDE
jgi:hypothetical protein